MGFEELWEKYRIRQLAYIRTRLAVLDSLIPRYQKDIEVFSEPTPAFSEKDRALALGTYKELLEGAERERHYYRAEVARLEGFDIIRADVH
jgi:hypothetical protein